MSKNHNFFFDFILQNSTYCHLFILENIIKKNSHIYAFLFFFNKRKYSERSSEIRHMSDRSELASPSPSETRHQLALVVQVFLNLFPHVEDRTIPAAEETVGTALL